MKVATAQQDEMVDAVVELTVADATIRARLTVPAGPTLTSELLPACRELSGALVAIAADQVRERGETVSCRAGCAACCRHVVPLSEPEARALVALVERMDEPRRTEVMSRFEAGRKRLEESCLPVKLDEVCDSMDDVQRYAVEYLRLGIPCPFLENENCSIYPDRPLICREYLVTSPAANCARPSADTIRMVPMPARISAALIRVGLAPEEKRTRWVPLLFAPEWVAGHPVEQCELTGPELLEQLFANLGERRRSDSASASESGRGAADPS
jgi:Fe-S-cluster containining protein